MTIGKGAGYFLKQIIWSKSVKKQIMLHIWAYIYMKTAEGRESGADLEILKGGGSWEIF